MEIVSQLKSFEVSTVVSLYIIWGSNVADREEVGNGFQNAGE